MQAGGQRFDPARLHQDKGRRPAVVDAASVSRRDNAESVKLASLVGEAK